MDWIRIRMDLELLPGSGSATRKIQSWIRIRNDLFRIRNTRLKISTKGCWYFNSKLTQNQTDPGF